MEDGLQLLLLGQPQIVLKGRLLLKLHTAKTEALLYFLALSRQPQPRELLADLLWPEMTDDQARRNLTQSVTALRKQLAEFLVVEPQRIGLKPEAPIYLDVTDFEARAESDDVEQLSQAVTLYREEFLKGLLVKHAYLNS